MLHTAKTEPWSSYQGVTTNPHRRRNRRRSCSPSGGVFSRCVKEPNKCTHYKKKGTNQKQAVDQAQGHDQGQNKVSKVNSYSLPNGLACRQAVVRFHRCLPPSPAGVSSPTSLQNPPRFRDQSLRSCVQCNPRCPRRLFLDIRGRRRTRKGGTRKTEHIKKRVGKQRMVRAEFLHVRKQFRRRGRVMYGRSLSRP